MTIPGPSFTADSLCRTTNRIENAPPPVVQVPRRGKRPPRVPYRPPVKPKIADTSPSPFPSSSSSSKEHGDGGNGNVEEHVVIRLFSAFVDRISFDIVADEAHLQKTCESKTRERYNIDDDDDIYREGKKEEDPFDLLTDLQDVSWKNIDRQAKHDSQTADDVVRGLFRKKDAPHKHEYEHVYDKGKGKGKDGSNDNKNDKHDKRGDDDERPMMPRGGIRKGNASSLSHPYVHTQIAPVRGDTLLYWLMMASDPEAELRSSINRVEVDDDIEDDDAAAVSATVRRNIELDDRATQRFKAELVRAVENRSDFVESMHLDSCTEGKERGEEDKKKRRRKLEQSAIESVFRSLHSIDFDRHSSDEEALSYITTELGVDLRIVKSFKEAREALVMPSTSTSTSTGDEDEKDIYMNHDRILVLMKKRNGRFERVVPHAPSPSLS